ncbi:MAG: TonB-dependent receptor plug domain-containing protein [Spirosomataceae bacterium]
MKKYTLLLLFSCLTSSLWAQNLAKDTIRLNEVIIRERGKAAQERAEIQHHAQSVGVLMEKDLNRNNPMFLDQTLGTMAGVQVDRRTQLGGQRIVIRGYGNDQKFNNWGVKIYYNGIPFTSADGVTLLDDVDFGIVSRIEVVKGPAATMYGSGVGGVARFYLRPMDRKGFTVSEKVAVGSFGLLQSSTRLDVVNDSSSVSLTYGHLQSDGFRANGSSLKNFITLFADHKFNKKQSMSVYFSQNYSLEGVSGQIPYADYYAGIDNGNPAYIKKNARNDFLATRFSISHNYSFSKYFNNRTSVFYSNQDLRRVSAGADESSMNPNFGVRSVFAWNRPVNENLTNELSFGTEIQESRSLVSSYRFLGTDDANPLKVRDISAGSYFKNITNQQSYFAINKLHWTQLDFSLILGLSANKIKYNRIDLLAPLGLVANYNKDLGFSKSFTTSFNPHIAIQKGFGKKLVTLSYSEGYNAPTAATAFIGTINVANDDLLPEKAKMFDLGIQGMSTDNRLYYQASLFAMNIANKLTQLSGTIAGGGTYTYFANTGTQKNNGFELSAGYLIVSKNNGFISKVEPFLTYSYYDFEYTDFKTRFGGVLADYSGKKVVGVPDNKYTLGLDIETSSGLYLNNTYNYMGSVYTDFANTNLVKSFGLLNGKIGYKKIGKKLDFDLYVAGNNLTNQINYTFLFLGNNVNDSDAGSGFPTGVATDVNPGPKNAYFFGGANLKLKF